MPYEHTVVSPFAVAGGRTYAIGQKITDEAEADSLYAKHFGRNLSRHAVTTVPDPEPEPEPEPAPKLVPQPPKPAAPAPPAAS